MMEQIRDEQKPNRSVNLIFIAVGEDIHHQRMIYANISKESEGALAR